MFQCFTYHSFPRISNEVVCSLNHFFLSLFFFSPFIVFLHYSKKVQSMNHYTSMLHQSYQLRNLQFRSLFIHHSVSFSPLLIFFVHLQVHFYLPDLIQSTFCCISLLHLSYRFQSLQHGYLFIHLSSSHSLLSYSSIISFSFHQLSSSV